MSINAKTSVSSQEDKATYSDELQNGATLLDGQYTIDRFVNSGGFGIAYLATDRLGRPTLIKECFAEAFCRRDGQRVVVRSPQYQADFLKAVDLFIKEARRLASFEHPNVVKVNQVFECNDTAYMSLELIEGDDLLNMIEDGYKFQPDQVVSMLKKLLAALEHVHSEGVLHRDISPDNVMIAANDEPVLIDFGAAKEKVSKASRALSELRVVKDGYSPHEFYITGAPQTPASDLYSLGASFYHLISGKTPENAQSRLAAIAGGDDDIYEPLSGRYESYPANFLELIDKALKVMPNDRPQSAREWLTDLSDGSEVSYIKPPREMKMPVQPAPSESEEAVEKAVEKVVAEGAADAALPVTPEVVAADVEVVKKQPPKLGLLVGASGVAILAACAYFFMQGGSTPNADVASDTAETETPEIALSDAASSGPAVSGQSTSSVSKSTTPAVENTVGASGAVAGGSLDIVEPVAPVLEGLTSIKTTVVQAGGDLGSPSNDIAPSLEADVGPGLTRLAVLGAPAAHTPAPEVFLDVPKIAKPTESQQEAGFAKTTTSGPVKSVSWKFDFPFTSDVEVNAEGRLSLRVDEPTNLSDDPMNNWIVKGTEIAQVNGAEVNGFGELLASLTEKNANNTYQSVTVSVFARPPEIDSYYVQNMKLFQTAIVYLESGIKVENVMRNGRWALRVVDNAGITGSVVRPGDIILMVFDTSSTSETVKDLEDAIKIATSSGRSRLNVLVARNGQNVVAELPFE